MRAEDLPPAMREQVAASWRRPYSPNGQHKYGAMEVWVDNIRFGSRLEAGHYGQLKLLKSAGEIRTFLRQVPIHLPGGVKHIVDWLVIRDGVPPLFAESKGYDLPLGRLKRKQVRDIHGIEIVLWRKTDIELPR